MFAVTRIHMYIQTKVSETNFFQTLTLQLSKLRTLHHCSRSLMPMGNKYRVACRKCIILCSNSQSLSYTTQIVAFSVMKNSCCFWLRQLHFIIACGSSASFVACHELQDTCTSTRIQRVACNNYNCKYTPYANICLLCQNCLHINQKYIHIYTGWI